MAQVAVDHFSELAPELDALLRQSAPSQDRLNAAINALEAGARPLGQLLKFPAPSAQDLASLKTGALAFSAPQLTTQAPSTSRRTPAGSRRRRRGSKRPRRSRRSSASRRRTAHGC